jgi:DNA-binding transcriptional LysR family regulator
MVSPTWVLPPQTFTSPVANPRTMVLPSGRCTQRLNVAGAAAAIEAIRALRAHQSMAQRRLAELARSTGRQLIKRQASGCRLTEAGEALPPRAERVAQAVNAAEQHLAASWREVLGVIRATCPNRWPVGSRRPGTSSASTRAAPGLVVEFVISDRYLGLAEGEADLAPRSGDTEDDEPVGRKVAGSLWALCAGARAPHSAARPTASRRATGTT